MTTNYRNCYIQTRCRNRFSLFFFSLFFFATLNQQNILLSRILIFFIFFLFSSLFFFLSNKTTNNKQEILKPKEVLIIYPFFSPFLFSAQLKLKLHHETANSKITVDQCLQQQCGTRKKKILIRVKESDMSNFILKVSKRMA